MKNKKLIIVLSIIGAVLVAGIFFVVIKNKNNKQDDITGFELTSAEENRSFWENRLSDIGGLTLWDKYSLGLAVNDGSDTDNDGLSDRDEIKIYNTDPLLSSTAGDLYTDGYKVENGMDPSKYYDYAEDLCFTNNFCPEIALYATKPEDLNAVVTDKTGTDLFNGSIVYAQYEIYNYSGKLSIDLNRVLAENNTSIKNISVFASDGTDPQKLDFTNLGNTITPEFDFITEQEYDLYVIDKSLAKLKFGTLFSGVQIQPASTLDAIEGEGLVCCYPILTELIYVPVKIYYEDQGSPAANEALGEKVLAHAKQYWGKYLNEEQYSEKSVKAISPTALKMKLWFWKLVIPNGNLEEIATKDIEKNQLFFVYYSYSDRLAYELAHPEILAPTESVPPTQEESENTPQSPTDDALNSSSPTDDTATNTKFDFATDTLPFGNFSTDTAPNGTCAGIAHFTAKLFNSGTYYSTGSFENISWNIATHSENKTLLDRGLFDYKDENFVFDHSLDGSRLGLDMSPGEKQFQNMIDAAYLLGNTAINNTYNEGYGGENSKTQTDYALIEEMCQRLDSGEVLVVYLRMKDSSGHAVNIYDYTIDGANTVRFKVYDCNFPRNNTLGYKLSKTGFVLTVTKKLKTNGQGYTFAYEYAPLSDLNYGATSNRAITEYPLFIVLNDDYVDINPKVTYKWDNYPNSTESDDFAAYSCNTHNYSLYITQNNRRVSIMCCNCRKLHDPLTEEMSLDTFAEIYRGIYFLAEIDDIIDEFDYNYTRGFEGITDEETREKVKVLYIMYLSQDYVPDTLMFLNSLEGGNNIGIKKNWLGKVTPDTPENTDASINEYLSDFNAYLNTLWDIAENSDELQGCASKDEILEEFVDSELLRLFGGNETFETFTAWAKAFGYLYNLKNNAGTTHEATLVFLDAVNYIISLADSNLLLGDVYTAQIESLKDVCQGYFKSYENYENLLFVYDELINGELTPLFHSDKDPEAEFFIKAFMTKTPLSECWADECMPTFPEMVYRLSQKDAYGQRVYDGLSQKSKLLIAKYLEYRLHLEYEQKTGVTLEYYMDLISPETTGILWWKDEVAPWEKELDPKDYDSPIYNISLY